MDAYKDNAAGGEVCAEWAVVTIKARLTDKRRTG
jgi:hypothetical protein